MKNQPIEKGTENLDSSYDDIPDEITPSLLPSVEPCFPELQPLVSQINRVENPFENGLAFQLNGKFEDARICYKLIIDSKSTDSKLLASATFNCGWCYEQEESLDEAKRYYQDVMTLGVEDENLVKAWLGYARCCKQQSLHDEAMLYYKQAMLSKLSVIDKNLFANASFHYAWYCEKKEWFDDAKSYYFLVTMLGPDDDKDLLAKAYLYYGFICEDQGNVEEAIKAYSWFNKIKPADKNLSVQAFLSCAELYEKQGMFEDAIACCKEILALGLENSVENNINLVMANSRCIDLYSKLSERHSEQIKLIQSGGQLPQLVSNDTSESTLASTDKEEQGKPLTFSTKSNFFNRPSSKKRALPQEPNSDSDKKVKNDNVAVPSSSPRG